MATRRAKGIVRSIAFAANGTLLLRIVWPGSYGRVACNGSVRSAHYRAGSRTNVPDRTTKPPGRSEPGGDSFESVYRANVHAVSAFFARRCTDQHLVADLTSETFVRAIGSLHTFQARGSMRSWLLAIARAVYAQHVEQAVTGRQAVGRLSGRVEFDDDTLDALEARIDAERPGRELLARAARLPDLERTAIELVDIAGIRPRDAARTLGISAGALRVRLHRARTQLRKEQPS
jgi:RNA polymerase sigma factor (sigma-70 family)